MKSKSVVLILMFASILWSCGSEEKKLEKSPEVLKEEARTAIEQEREKLLSATGPLNPTKAENMINLYITFVQNNPDDAEAQEYLFQAGSIAVSKGEYERAIRLYDQVIRNYPDEKRSPDAWFMKAFVLQNNLNRRGAAEDAYKKVIELYPRHELALEARAALKTINMTDEELIEYFEKMNNIE